MHGSLAAAAVTQRLPQATAPAAAFFAATSMLLGQASRAGMNQTSDNVTRLLQAQHESVVASTEQQISGSECQGGERLLRRTRTICLFKDEHLFPIGRETLSSIITLSL